MAGGLVVLTVALLAAVSAVVVTEPAFGSFRAGCVAALAAPPPKRPGRKQPGVLAVWSPDQRANAQSIVDVGRQLGAPIRAQWIALATAMQESMLVNRLGGDRDSVGLFQQRPSQGWGTREQLTNPEFAAQAFYERLLALAGWEAMPLAEAAQAVQRSAFPEAYAKWEQPAADLLAESGNSVDSLVCGIATVAAGAAGVALEFADEQLGKPYQWGATAGVPQMIRV
ncbi:hypothetical protein LWC33_29270 [Pseudonocardia sp. RS11V-5]|uniref:hypothetical protein n=1 Tax=Pseudonocardia terrae TaxID=2905831 RepID=UPI001E2BFBD6|nr:hypothetical protein [Pseudonocardia terrae]MCE3555524.1 hypothetical protein [Pseudonocardia terrae]